MKLRAWQKRVQDNFDVHAQNATIPPPASNQEIVISQLYIYEKNCESRSSGRLSQAGRREKYFKMLNYINLPFNIASNTTGKKTVASLWEKGVEDKVLESRTKSSRIKARIGSRLPANTMAQLQEVTVLSVNRKKKILTYFIVFPPRGFSFKNDN